MPQHEATPLAAPVGGFADGSEARQGPSNDRRITNCTDAANLGSPRPLIFFRGARHQGQSAIPCGVTRARLATATRVGRSGSPSH